MPLKSGSSPYAKNNDGNKEIEKIISKEELKNNYIWNMLGTVSSSLISVVLLLLASRFLDSRDSDIFSIAYALGQQFFVLGYFQVRNLQSTDVKERYQFASYHNTRLFTIFLMILTSFIYTLWQGYDVYKSSIILLLVLYRAIDAYSDVFQGLFQQKNRSDLAGKVQFYRSWICMLIFAMVLLLTKSLMVASIVICFANFILTLPLDFRICRLHFSQEKFSPKLHGDRKNMYSILKNSFPLFLNGFLITYIYNEPKIDIDYLLTNCYFSSGVQRDFNVLFMPVFVLSLLFFVLRPLTTQLSIYWNEKKFTLFFKQVNTLYLVMTVLGVAIVVLGYLIGTEVLGAVYGIRLQEYKLPFTILLIGGILNVFALVVDIIMTIFRKQHYLMIAYLLTFAVSKSITLPFIRGQKLLGAANSFLISMCVFYATSLIIYGVVKNKEKRKK